MNGCAGEYVAKEWSQLYGQLYGSYSLEAMNPHSFAIRGGFPCDNTIAMEKKA